MVRSGGVVGVLEFSSPARLVDFVYRLYFVHMIPWIGGIVTGSRASYEYLTASVDEFPEGERFLELMRGTGLVKVSSSRLTGGIATFYKGERP